MTANVPRESVISKFLEDLSQEFHDFTGMNFADDPPLSDAVLTSFDPSGGIIRILLAQGVDPILKNAMGGLEIDFASAEVSGARDPEDTAIVQASLDLINARISPN